MISPSNLSLLPALWLFAAASAAIAAEAPAPAEAPPAAPAAPSEIRNDSPLRNPPFAIRNFSVAPTFRPALEKALPAVVKIYGGKIGDIPGYGSGVLVSPDGHILTNHTLMLTASRITAVLTDGRTFVAKIHRKDPARNVVLLKVEGRNLPHLPPGDSSRAYPGQWVLSVGNAFKLAAGDAPPSVNLGVVSAVSTLDARMGKADFPYKGRVFITDAANNEGAYGGALVDREGNFIGLVGRLLISNLTNTQINYAIPTNDLKDFVEEGVRSREPQRVGVAAGPAEKTAGFHGIVLLEEHKTDAPAYVESVLPGGPADRAGVKPDDLITHVNGAFVNTVKDFREALEKLSAGDTLALQVVRRKKVNQIEMTLEEEGK